MFFVQYKLLPAMM